MTRLLIAALLVSVAPSARAGWDEPLRKAVTGCDRIRVRSGGTCHRDPEEEKTLFESKDARVLSAFLATIEIDERRSGSSCMCCGEPTFELYRGDRLLAMIGFHHGQALRWDDGAWSGDAALTPKSALAICRWLAEHEIDGPLKALEEEMARERARAERARRYGTILPAPALRALREARSKQEARAALIAASSDAADRTVAWFRMFGCHEGRWSHSTQLDSLLEELLAEVPPEVMATAVARLGGDAWALNGAARYLLECRREASVPAPALKEALPALAARAFAHPHRECRRSAMAGVARIGGPEAVAALRVVLAGRVKVRKLPDADRVDAGGMVTFRPTADEVSEPNDDRVVAAWLLHGLGDRECEAIAAAMLAGAKGKDQEVLRSILEK